MRLQKTSIILAILVMVLALGTPLGLEGKNHNNGPDVEEIYQSIRNGAPLYQWDESIVEFPHEGMNLTCTLTVPIVNHPCPIILVLHGFGGDRKGVPITGTNEQFWDPLARILAEHGFCCLRLDFHGVGDSEGTYEKTTFTGQVSDAIASLNFIKTLNNPVNPYKIGLVGHSQGGLVASLVAADDRRIDSTVLWSAVGLPAHDYEGFLLKQGIKSGLALPDGGITTLGLYLDGVYLGDITLCKQFFVELFTIDPMVAIRSYKKPLMYISPTQDVVVWPQPLVGQTFMNYHPGTEKLVTLDACHNFSFYLGPDRIEDAAYWTTAWFIKTL
jgi:pimeloyl-ACP methyl ester carboxylesterase